MSKSVLDDEAPIELPMWRVADDAALRGADRIRLAFVFGLIAIGIVGVVHLFPTTHANHVVDRVSLHRT